MARQEEMFKELWARGINEDLGAEGHGGGGGLNTPGAGGGGGAKVVPETNGGRGGWIEPGAGGGGGTNNDPGTGGGGGGKGMVELSNGEADGGMLWRLNPGRGGGIGTSDCGRISAFDGSVEDGEVGSSVLDLADSFFWLLRVCSKTFLNFLVASESILGTGVGSLLVDSKCQRSVCTSFDLLWTTTSDCN